ALDHRALVADDAEGRETDEDHDRPCRLPPVRQAPHTRCSPSATRMTPKTTNASAAKTLIARSGRRAPRSAPMAIASASAATIPAVEPSAVPIVRIAQRPTLLARPSSVAPSESPRRVQAAKKKNARPATTWMAGVGRVRAKAFPTSTEPAW